MKNPSLLSKRIKTFDQRVREGELFPLTRAAEITGYSERYLSRLCDTRKIPHVRRLGKQYFFTLAQLNGVFEVVAPAFPPTQGTGPRA